MNLKIILSRPIFSYYLLLLLSPVYHRANAQLSGGQSSLSTPAAYEPGGNFNQSMAVVVVFLMCAFFAMAFFSIYLRHCFDSNEHAASATTVNRSRHHGLDPAVIETFPILFYSAIKDLKIGKAALECAVCLTEFEDHETLRLLPKCNHVFHPDCIDAWLASHVTCPVCRAKLKVEPGKLAADSAAQPAELNPESVQENSAHGLNEEQTQPQNHVAISVDEIQSRDSQVLEMVNAGQTTPKQDRPARPIISGKFPRSHSTGHSLVHPGENTERCTLRLPEELRKQILVSGKLKRSSSCDVVFGMVGSSTSRKGSSKSVDRQFGRSDWWVFSVTPPFVSRGASVKSPKLSCGV